ncbi:MAG: 16S rRNA (cytidine(1402)-2'-O)-methyltransferase [Dehalococcoidia bacterium]
MGVLHLVGTPIGNLDDISLRALRILREAALVLAEDTRTARRLLDRHALRARLLSYTEHNHVARLPAIFAALEVGDVALVSEAGMPGINDPGQLLVPTVVAAGFQVSAVPGPSAVPMAVALAGFPVPTFTFIGFLPHSSGERRGLLTANAAGGHALVAFETPHRLADALTDISDVLGNREIAVCRELTKHYEEVFRGTVQAAIEHFGEPRGEFTLVIRGQLARLETPQDELTAFLVARLETGAGARDAVAAAVARFGVGRRAAYDAWVGLKNADGQL